MKKIFFLIMNFFLSCTVTAMESSSNSKAEIPFLPNLNSNNVGSSDLHVFEGLYLSSKEHGLENDDSSQTAMLETYFNLSEKDKLIALQFLIENKIYLIGINEITENKAISKSVSHINDLPQFADCSLEIDVRIRETISKNHLGLLSPLFKLVKEIHEKRISTSRVIAKKDPALIIIEFLLEPAKDLKTNIRNVKALASTNIIMALAVLGALSESLFGSPDLGFSMNLAAALSHVPLIKLFQKYKLNLNYQDVCGMTPLMYAAMCNAKCATKYLLDQKTVDLKKLIKIAIKPWTMP